jgi:N5-(cytidine 5'-diphosphoramidyl)-L-glutamine hydrolase
MRRSTARGYAEERDALARGWARFLASALPECVWMPVPNLGTAVAEYADEWRLNGLILTGGDDLGDDPVRDASETVLLNRALSQGHPVFAVCRGLQLIQDRFGGPVEACSQELHLATRHVVSFMSTAPAPTLRGTRTTVNSFHRCGIHEERLAPVLSAFARSQDGVVEGAAARAHRMVAVMWHPEREPTALSHDVLLVRALFGLREATATPPDAHRAQAHVERV